MVTDTRDAAAPGNLAAEWLDEIAAPERGTQGYMRCRGGWVRLLPACDRAPVVYPAALRPRVLTAACATGLEVPLARGAGILAEPLGVRVPDLATPSARSLDVAMIPLAGACSIT
jgi:hypothetical protein